MMLAIVNLIVYLIINSSVAELSLRFFILMHVPYLSPVI